MAKNTIEREWAILDRVACAIFLIAALFFLVS